MKSERPNRPSLLPDPTQPRGWPIDDAGLYMAFLGPVMVVHLDNGLTESSWQRHLHELARAIDTRPPIRKYGVLYHVPAADAVDATRRSEITKLMNAKSAALQRLTGAFSFVTESALARGIMNTIFWVAPPGYPYAVVATTLHGFRFLEDKVPGVDGAACEREFARLQSVWKARATLRAAG